MAKKEIAKIKLQIPAGAANPSPPVGPALGQHGLNIMEFCKAFNAKTQEEKGMINYRIFRSLFFLYYQNSSCRCSDCQGS